MAVEFVPVDRNTRYLFPHCVQDYLPEEHLARFVVDIVERWDVSPLVAVHEGRGSKPYHPRMMLALLFYGYAIGTFSSRKLEQSTYDHMAYMYVCANEHPDHDSINTFRQRFLKELKGLFLAILVIAIRDPASRCVSPAVPDDPGHRQGAGDVKVGDGEFGRHQDQGERQPTQGAELAIRPGVGAATAGGGGRVDAHGGAGGPSRTA